MSDLSADLISALGVDSSDAPNLVIGVSGAKCNFFAGCIVSLDEEETGSLDIGEVDDGIVSVILPVDLGAAGVSKLDLDPQRSCCRLQVTNR